MGKAHAVCNLLIINNILVCGLDSHFVLFFIF